MAATLSVGGFVAHRCQRHGFYALREDAPQGCPRCCKNDRKAREKAARRSLFCDACAAELLTPAVLCGFCSIDDENPSTPRERQ
jgi:hypothetical protein